MGEVIPFSRQENHEPHQEPISPIDWSELVKSGLKAARYVLDTVLETIKQSPVVGEEYEIEGRSAAMERYLKNNPKQRS